jgi:hypothetical protein
MNKYVIFDNGGKTADRFTIINKTTGDVFGVSENPDDANGIAKCCGNCADHKIVLYGAGWRQKLPPKKVIQAEVEHYINNARLNASWLGLEAELTSLPQSVRDYITRLDDPQQTDQFSKANITYMSQHPLHEKGVQSIEKAFNQ